MCLPGKVSGKSIQGIASFVGSLLCLNFGLMFGITPPHAMLYESSVETPLKHVIDAEAANWISAYLFVGVVIGALFIGLLTRQIGPKSVLYLGCLLQVTSWFTIHFASDIMHIYASRIFAGVAAGASFVALPIFINEITTDSSLAATLTTLSEFWRTLGIFIGFLFGQYFHYDLVSIIGIAISLFSTLLMAFVQESPFYYMRKENSVSMEKSLRWYRGIRDMDDRGRPEFLREVDDFNRKMCESKPIISSEIPCGYKLKLGVYCGTLILGTQFAGVYIVLNYALKIYSNTHVALIFAAMQLLGATLAIWLGMRVRRKLLVIITGIASGCVLIVVAWTDKLITFDTDTALTITIGLLSLHMLSASLGLQPFSIIIVHELLPSKLRASYLSVIYSITWLLLFGLLQSYYYLATVVSLKAYFSLFAGSSFLVALLAIFILPETESKSPEEVQHEMGFVGIESIAKISTIYNGQIHEHGYN